MTVGKEPGFFQKITGELDAASQIVWGQPRITITGTGELLLEGHKGILEYSEEQISVNGAGTIIKIRGSGLTLGAMTRRELLIQGQIISVEFVF